ncbi:acyltransferase family protein [Ornithobacterium rhinotracheale]
MEFRYIIYPIIFALFSGGKKQYIKYSLIILCVISLILFLFFGTTASKFYLIQYRFFQLGFGGILAIIFYRIQTINKNYIYLVYVSIIAMFLLLAIPYKNNTLGVISTTLFSGIYLTFNKYFNDVDKVTKVLFSNKIFVFIGKISFSLYMWHQVVLAFSRYSFFETLNFTNGFILTLIILALSIFSYYAIENTFRNKKLISTRNVLIVVGIFFTFSISLAFYLNSVRGVFKDYPSLNLYTKDNKERGFKFISSSYDPDMQFNDDVRKLDKPFDSSQNKKKVLVLGDSFARDVVNIIKESSIDNLDISYLEFNKKRDDISTDRKRLIDADVIFIARNRIYDKAFLKEIQYKFNIDISTKKFFVFGYKNYGYSNGIYFRCQKNNPKEQCLATIKPTVLNSQQIMEKNWGAQYINLMEPLKVGDDKIRVFTPDGKFVSHDTLHLSINGAKYYGKILSSLLKKILSPL